MLMLLLDGDWSNDLSTDLWLIIMTTKGTWEFLPEELLLKIFFFLDAKVRGQVIKHYYSWHCCQDIARAGQSCRRWLDLSSDNILWRKIILRDFMIEDHRRLDNLEASSWRSEYQRLVDHTPEICTEVWFYLRLTWSSRSQSVCVHSIFKLFSSRLQALLEQSSSSLRLILDKSWSIFRTFLKHFKSILRA